MSQAGTRHRAAMIQIDLIDADAMRLWRAVASLARTFGEERRWCLVGGLMVALFAIEAEQRQRATTDIDILTDARARPSATKWAAERLQSLGATLREPTGLDHERGFRFDFGGQIVDVLAPDGLRPKGAKTVGNLETIGIPGGTQALRRVEIVEILVDGQPVKLRRPTLIAAILLKARALPVHSNPEAQRHDLVSLLSLLHDPSAARDVITGNEIGWLRRISDRLAIDDAGLVESFDRSQLRAADAAYRMLTD